MDDLNSILTEQTETDTGEETQVESQGQETAEGQEHTGEQETAPPAAEQEEDESTKRIKGLEAATAAERRRRQQLEQQLAELMAERQQAQKPPPQQAQQQTQPTEPAREDFTSDADYFRALARHEAQQLREAERAEERQRQEQRQQEELIAARQAALDKVVERGQERFPDFDATINSGLAPFLTPVLQDALLQLDRSDEVAYWLARNPAEAGQVAKLPPARMLTRLAVIEATKLDAEATQRNTSIPQTLTQARNASGQFQKAYSGPTPLDDILARKT